MNRAIEIQFPRTLLLENVVTARVEIDRPTRIQEAALALTRFIRAHGAAPRGPLLQVVRADQETGRNPPSVDLLRQASAPIVGDGDRYSFDASLEVSGCLLARFQGDAVHLPVAYSKLAVFSYENDVTLAGVFYVVYVEEEGSAITADIFATTGED